MAGHDRKDIVPGTLFCEEEYNFLSPAQADKFLTRYKREVLKVKSRRNNAAYKGIPLCGVNGGTKKVSAPYRELEASPAQLRPRI